jgi:hypothetical protein
LTVLPRLFHCLQSCSVNDDVLRSPANPLLVVNQWLQTSMAQQRKQRSGGAGAQQQRAGASAGQLGTRRSTLSATAAGAGSLGCVVGQPLTPSAAAPPGGLIMSPRSVTAPVTAAH